MNTDKQSGLVYSRNGKTLFSPSFGYIASVTGCNTNPEKIVPTVDTFKLKRKFRKSKGKGA